MDHVQGYVNFTQILPNETSGKGILFVYRLKSVGALEMEFVAPIPEQIATTTTHYLKVPGELC